MSAADRAPRLLLIRTSALGDVVHSLPVAVALRRALPQARLGWVIEEAFAPLVTGHVDEVIPVRLRGWRHAPLAAPTRREVRRAVRSLRAFRADVAVDLMGSHKSGLLALLSGAPRRLGARRADRREPSSAAWIDQPVALAGTHAVDRALSLVAPLGVTALAADFAGERIPPHPAATAAAQRLDPAAAQVLIQPGAAWGNKRYPPAWWGEVAVRIAAGAAGACGVLAGPGEEPLAAAVVAASRGAARPLHAPELTTLVAALRDARLVLGGDTGPLHLAHALGTPVLAVMGPTDPARHGPYGAPERALWRRLPCSFCYKRFGETKACLLEIPPSLVAAHALSSLRSASPSPPPL